MIMEKNSYPKEKMKKNENIALEGATLENDESFFFDGKILSSCHINFLLGAGFNDRITPLMSELTETQNYLKSILSTDCSDVEKAMTLLSDEAQRQKAEEVFNKELRDKINNIPDLEAKPGYQDIERLIRAIYRLVDSAENRNRTMKQINVFTLNYDTLFERGAYSAGKLCHVITPANFDKERIHYNVIGYRPDIDRFIPTFLVHKLHGTVDDMVYPGSNKFQKGLDSVHYEMLFNFKSILMREYSVLFVIGYSGADDDINVHIKDAYESGLTIYWFKYRESDKIPEKLKDLVIEIENDCPEGKPKNGAKFVAERLEKICQR